ncbi:hypothetical protein OS493_020928 [Desmophyllum pertusum]|uniref:Uncharacterized protein n=1 Tax=Desmophyllum pertusum TaxID=174260 RepID=A0A9X0A131_9CNID|nr:hypothetical protein OS493_020928 [Desmophyllum pertusum]
MTGYPGRWSKPMGAQGLNSLIQLLKVQGGNWMSERENSLPNWKTGITSSRDEELQVEYSWDQRVQMKYLWRNNNCHWGSLAVLNEDEEDSHTHGVGEVNTNWKGTIGTQGLGVMDENGVLFADFCALNKLVIGGSLFPHQIARLRTRSIT